MSSFSLSKWGARRESNPRQLVKSQLLDRRATNPKHGTGVEDRTPLIFFVGEAPSPDDNPGVKLVAALGFEPSLRSYLELCGL